jgi:vancomycin resistance protein YoaR
MRTRTIPTQPVPSTGDLISQIIVMLMGGFFLFAGAVLVVAIGFNLYYSGKIYPGITVAGIEIGGLTPQDAAARLSTRLIYPQVGRVVLKDGEQMWVATPDQVGLYLSLDATAQEAASWGRHGGPAARLTEQFQAWYAGVNFPPQMIYDERIAQAYLNNLAQQINVPTIEASLQVNGLDVVVKPGQVGRSLDIPASLQDIRSQVVTLKDGIVPLTITDTAPAILDASHEAEIARGFLSAPLTLRVPGAGDGDPGPWVIETADLARMLTIDRVSTADGDQYQVGLNTEELRSFLEGIAPDLALSPENARFTFNDGTHKLELIEPAVVGRSLLVDDTLLKINEDLRSNEHKVGLVFAYTDPQVGDDATAKKLGITELVSNYTSYFYGSSASRIQNITTAAQQFHGVLVAPGETFSMANTLGDVSLDTGYAEALIIYGDRTIQGVGGGVCQVSTTLFRTVFFGGFPIVERNPHAYRVSYYEQRADGSDNPSLAGLDATVYVPYVDFKFTNDTSNWLLMETYVNQAARTLTWKFYSTSDGRTVDWDTTGPQNVEEPPDPVYNENPELAKGTIKQVDWAAEGADITVDRTVYKGNQVYLEDTFYTHYMPWRAVYEYGPGTKVPKNNNKDDSNP